MTTTRTYRATALARATDGAAPAVLFGGGEGGEQDVCNEGVAVVVAVRVEVAGTCEVEGGGSGAPART